MSNEKKSKNKKGLTIKIIDNPELERVYSNYVAVTTGPHDCNITFCRIDPLNVTATKGEARVVLKVSIPNSLVEDVLRVIEKNYKNALKQIEASKPKTKKPNLKK